MKFEEFAADLDKALAEKMTKAGFCHVNAGCWRRLAGENVNVIWVQKNSVEDTCCVNLGIHYSFLPKVGVAGKIENDQISQPECEIKMRLTSNDSKKDQWWAFSSVNIQEILQLIVSRGEEMFSNYSLNGKIRNIQVGDITRGDSELLKHLTKVRACLLLVHIHDHFEERDKSIEIAKLGLQIAGMAVGPKKFFKETLKRYGELD